MADIKASNEAKPLWGYPKIWLVKRKHANGLKLQTLLLSATTKRY
ncbi:hypothetical protein [Prevotellamassilia timonensis]